MTDNGDDIRPSPEAFLKLAQAEEAEAEEGRGKLKIFLGYAAGVGKTFAMLEAGEERRLEGRDVVGLAATGTGKTAAFAVPMIHDLMMNMDHRALIMAPTRELAQQIMEECLSFSKGCSLRGALLIGGASMHLQKRDLRGNPRIVVGTPGRIKDHLRQGTLLLKFFNYTVLDEVDRMLDMGFINDITSILAETNPVRQSLFFSATMEPKIERLIKGFSKDPVTVSIVQGAAADGVDQNVVYYNGNADKIEKLHELLIKPGCSKTIIFDETKRAVIVDPGEFNAGILSHVERNGFYVSAVLLTHNHIHHVRGLRTLLRIYEAEVYAATAKVLGFPCRVVSDGERLAVAGFPVEALSVPGHSPDSMVYRIDRLLFTGDSLFPGGVGKTWSPEDFTSLLGEVTEKVFDRLPDETWFYPGHGNDGRLGDDRPHLAEWRARGW